MSDKQTEDWPLDLAKTLEERPVKQPMGYSARQNETARKAAAGELHSRATIIGAMDQALELHASALRLLEAKIVALKERTEKVEALVESLRISQVIHGNTD